MNRTIHRCLFVLTFALALIFWCVAPSATAMAQTEYLTVNDSSVGSAPFTFSFSGYWGYEKGYPDHYFEGDEHWINKSRYDADYPSATLRFIGSSAKVYGHKVPDGAMAEVTLDGESVGRMDFYSPSRVEKTLVFDTGALPFGEHTLEILLIAEKNPSAGDGGEASIDYAEIEVTETLPVVDIEADFSELILEPDMQKLITYKLLPAYATESPDICFTSSDSDVVSAESDGTITAKKAGTATVTISSSGKDYSDTVSVTVREPLGGKLMGAVGDSNIHSENYGQLFKNFDPSLKNISLSAWRKDFANAKIDLLTKNEGVTGIIGRCGELKNERGDVLQAEVTVSAIKEVLSHDTGNKIPDVISHGGAVDMSAYEKISLWIRLSTPADALPGIYAGEITITGNGIEPLIFPLTVEVIALTYSSADVCLELWEYPYSSNRYYSGETTEEYFEKGCYATVLDDKYTEALRSQILLYAAAGGKAVTATIVEDPWNTQTPDPYPSMIKWSFKKEGGFSFDYTDFDKFVKLNLECGVDGPIFSFSISNWSNNITFYDEITESVVTEVLTPGSNRWKYVWKTFLRDYMRHTTEMGWFDRVYMAMDERPAPIVEAVLDLVESIKNEDGKAFRTSLAVYTFETEYLFDRVTNLSLAIGLPFDRLKEIAAHRRELGLVTTLYACGGEYNALENQPYESVYSLWYCEKVGADGFLRWALDSFNADPLTSSAHRLFAAGDIYLIYPDYADAENPTAHSSVRFEKIVQGCRDIAKLRYLKQAFPEYAKTLENLVQTLGTDADMNKEILQMENTLLNLARIAQLEQLLNECLEIPSEKRSGNMTQAIEAAQKILAAEDLPTGETENEIRAAAYELSLALSQYEKSKNTPPDGNKTWIIVTLSILAVVLSAIIIAVVIIVAKRKKLRTGADKK